MKFKSMFHENRYFDKGEGEGDYLYAHHETKDRLSGLGSRGTFDKDEIVSFTVT